MTEPKPPVRVEYLVTWLRQHRGSFTDDALRDRLLAAGHAPADVDTAFEMLGREPAAPVPPPGGTGTAPWPPPAATGRPARAGDTALGFLAAIGGIVGIPVLLTMAGTGNAAVAAGLVALLIALVAYAALRDSDRRDLARGVGAAILLAVILPVVGVIGVFGYCLVAGAPVL